MNRRTLKKVFDKEVSKCSVNKISLVMIDMDNFKMLNDCYGHCFGDVALKHFSGILTASVKASDSVARFAGDEFVLLLKDCDFVAAEKRMKDISQRMASQKLDEIVLKFSYGICELVSDGKEDFDTALGLADEKMYEHKRRKALLYD